MTSWRQVLEAGGRDIREQLRASSGFRRPGRPRRRPPTPTRASSPADAFVVATGAWTPLLNEQLGCRSRSSRARATASPCRGPSTCPAIPLIFPETRVAVTPFQSGYRLGSTMEFAGYDESIRPERLQLLKDGAAPYLREPYCEPVEEKWFGWRPMTYDSLPIIDRSPASTTSSSPPATTCSACRWPRRPASSSRRWSMARRRTSTRGRIASGGSESSQTARAGYNRPWCDSRSFDGGGGLMPVHDWTRVDAGIFHHFHLGLGR